MTERPVIYRGVQYPVLERYRVNGSSLLVVAKLGQAGRRVYRVFDTSAKEMRALHVLPDSPSAHQKITTLQRLTRGDNEILQILACIRQDEHLWVLLPWVDGFNLRQVLRDIREGIKPRVSAPEAVRLVKGVAHTLAHYHGRKQFVHADVKPANLILTNRTSLVLIDFGSAWPVERTATRSEGDGVSPSYAAPELLRGQVDVDFRADIFSVGVILYEMLTDQLPYDGVAGRAALLLSPSQERVALTPASQLSPERDKISQRIWRPIDTLLERSLALDRRGRYESPGAWLDAWSVALRAIRDTKGVDHHSSLVVRFFDWVQNRLGSGGP